LQQNRILIIVGIGAVVFLFARAKNILSYALIAAVIGAICIPFFLLFWIFVVVGLAEISGGGWSGYEPFLLALFIAPFSAIFGAIIGTIVGMVKSKLAS
jgi:hypothetical protein